jgi:hypothetical protein
MAFLIATMHSRFVAGFGIPNMPSMATLVASAALKSQLDAICSFRAKAALECCRLTEPLLKFPTQQHNEGFFALLFVLHPRNLKLIGFTLSPFELHSIRSNTKVLLVDDAKLTKLLCTCALSYSTLRLLNVILNLQSAVHTFVEVLHPKP